MPAFALPSPLPARYLRTLAYDPGGYDGASPPGGPVRGTASDLLLGDLLYHSPATLGPRAAALGISCQTCHPNGAAGTSFYLDGVSDRRGNVDLSTAFFRVEADDGRVDPVNIPSLRGARFIAPYGLDGRTASLGDFVQGVVTGEFQGEPLRQRELAALVRYVQDSRFPPRCLPRRPLAPDRASERGGAAGGGDLHTRTEGLRRQELRELPRSLDVLPRWAGPPAGDRVLALPLRDGRRLRDAHAPGDDGDGALLSRRPLRHPALGGRLVRCVVPARARSGRTGRSHRLRRGGRCGGPNARRSPAGAAQERDVRLRRPRRRRPGCGDRCDCSGAAGAHRRAPRDEGKGAGPAVAADSPARGGHRTAPGRRRPGRGDSSFERTWHASPPTGQAWCQTKNSASPYLVAKEPCWGARISTTRDGVPT